MTSAPDDCTCLEPPNREGKTRGWCSVCGGKFVAVLPQKHPREGVTINVKQCARCGCDHAHVTFRNFERRPDNGSVKEIQAWAPCPINGDPILLRVKFDPAWGKSK